jgi:hypothetical protein
MNDMILLACILIFLGLLIGVSILRHLNHKYKIQIPYNDTPELLQKHYATLRQIHNILRNEQSIYATSYGMLLDDLEKQTFPSSEYQTICFDDVNIIATDTLSAVRERVRVKHYD